MMPDVSAAVRHFEETMQFQLVTKTVTDGDVAEMSTVKPILWFEGVLEPMHPLDLMIKQEGQRKFKWWTLWTDLDLKTDTIIKDQNSLEYRVMNIIDWHGAGYRQYQLIEGPGL